MFQLTCIEVYPSLSPIVTSAPFSRKNFTILVLPCNTDCINGVCSPRGDKALMLAPCFKAAAAASVSSSPDASNKALSRSDSSPAEALLLDVDRAIRKNKDIFIVNVIVVVVVANCKNEHEGGQCGR